MGVEGGAGAVFLPFLLPPPASERVTGGFGTPCAPVDPKGAAPPPASKRVTDGGSTSSGLPGAFRAFEPPLKLPLEAPLEPLPEDAIVESG